MGFLFLTARDFGDGGIFFLILYIALVEKQMKWQCPTLLEV